MGWRLGIIAAMWTLMMWCSPAAAELQQCRDSQGVIHIRNAGPGTKTEPANIAPQEAPPAGETTATLPPIPAVPSREPGLNPPAMTVPAEPAAVVEPPAPPVSQTAAAVSPAGTIREEVKAPGQPVNCSAPAPAPALAPPIVSAPIPPISANGNVIKFRDHQGILHITNVRPGSDNGEALPFLAAQGERGEMAAAGSPAPPQAMDKRGNGPAPTFKPVSYPGDSGALAKSPAPWPHQPLAASRGGIRRYRDAQGVWHIENIAPEGLETQGTPLLAVRDGPGGGHDPPGNLTNPAAPEAIKPVSWVKGDIGPPLDQKMMAAQEARLLASSTIKRYRDAKGVLHIESVEPLQPLALPGPFPGVAPDHYGLVGRALAGLAPPAAAATRTAVRPDPSGPPVARIVASRDRQGRLIIRNPEAEVPVSRAPPPVAVNAALEPIIQEASQCYCLPPTLIRALIKAESDFVPWAVSPKGAMGLMQLMPGTAAFLGVQDAFDPRENIHGGCRYLRLMLDSFHGSLPLALAAYNAGYQRVVACGYQVPPIKETQEFVTQVLERFYLWENRGPWPWT